MDPVKEFVNEVIQKTHFCTCMGKTSYMEIQGHSKGKVWACKCMFPFEIEKGPCPCGCKQEVETPKYHDGDEYGYDFIDQVEKARCKSHNIFLNIDILNKQVYCQHCLENNDNENKSRSQSINVLMEDYSQGRELMNKHYKNIQVALNKLSNDELNRLSTTSTKIYHPTNPIYRGESIPLKSIEAAKQTICKIPKFLEKHPKSFSQLVDLYQEMERIFFEISSIEIVKNSNF